MSYKEPKLRTVSKFKPPYPINKFPKEFINKLGRGLVYQMATKSTNSLEGPEWEEIFADCINAKWKPSNVGLDDIVLGNCCWGAKTVIASHENISDQPVVRLISGRNSPKYSFDEDDYLQYEPNILGEQILSIWNERVSSIRNIYKHARTIVLVKGRDFKKFIVFEFETIRYDHDMFNFKWNKNNNLLGISKRTSEHTFTWQPHGSQFTIIEKIPNDRTHFKVNHPEKLDKGFVLDHVGYNDEWVTIID